MVKYMHTKRQTTEYAETQKLINLYLKTKKTDGWMDGWNFGNELTSWELSKTKNYQKQQK